MKNIAIIVPSLRAGGAERVASILSTELSQQYNVFLIIFNGEEKAYPYGGTLINLDIMPHSNYLVKLLNMFRRVYNVRKIKKQNNIESTISFMFGANIVNLLSKTNDKLIISVRSHLSKRPQNILSRLNKFIIRIVYNRADQIIGVSKGVSNDLIKNYGIKKEKISHIYNPIDIQNINKMKNEKILEDDKEYFDGFTIINVGRLTHAKSQWHLIRAMSKVKEEIPEAKLIIIGEGELEDYLKQLVVELNLDDTVFFLGYRENVFKYLHYADVFVLSSLYEGFPNVVLEAMACGLPIISTDCSSGPREILAPNTLISNKITETEKGMFGLLTPVMDGKKYDASHLLSREEEILAENIKKMYYNFDLRKKYSEKSIDRSKSYQNASILREWENII